MVSRRRMFGAAALAGGGVAAQETGLAPVARAHGMALSPERLRVLAPVLARREEMLRTLREFVIDDRLGPMPGVLDSGE